MVRYIGKGDVRTDEEINRFLDWILDQYKINEHYGLKLLLHKETDEKIGHAGIVPQIIEGEELLEIGYWIDENHWNKGYAKEAAEALKDFGLNYLQLDKMISLIQEGNTASEKVALSIGMRKEKQIAVEGKNVNVYSIFRSN
jgi:RimJ/RimL family protein N-acetyltransferase